MYRDAERNRTPSEEVLWKGTMRAGDVMHIPRGFWHAATRLGSGSGGHSLHVTFGFTKRTGVTWANFLSDAARADEAFRRDLECAEGTAHQVLTDKLGALAAAYSPERYLDGLRSSTPPARHMPNVTAFGRPEAVAAVTEFAPSISCVRVSVSGVAIRLVCCAARASREAFIAAHHSSDSCGSSATTALPTGVPGSSSVSSARHITGSASSRHATPASQAGLAIPRRASADAVPSPP